MKLLLAAIALLGLAAAPAALAKGRIPKHFAYAAEIRVTLDYDATFKKDMSFQPPCTVAGTDESTTATTSTHEEETLNRTVLYKHVTVPVVQAHQLGKAAHRLGLKPTVTTPGHTTAEHSLYDLSGVQLNDGENSCDTQNYDCPGLITNIGGLGGAFINSDPFDPEVWELPAFGIDLADPATCSATGDNQIDTELNIDAAHAYGQHWGVATLQNQLSSRLDALRKKSTVTFDQPIQGAQPCDDEGQTSCTQSVNGKAHVQMKRLFLYYTKRSYPK